MELNTSPTVPLSVKDCSAAEFKRVLELVRQFDLDDRELRVEEFVTVTSNGELLGFGRVREHKTCSELCSLGVLENVRTKGIGKLLMQAMIQKAKQEAYLVCVIPSYFMDLGFRICNEYPAEIQDKLKYCVGSLPVEEEYVVMKKEQTPEL